jgi:hypothetical protein
VYLQEHVERKAANFAKMNMKMQPHVVTISSALREGMTRNAVFQNWVFYECRSLIKAVDV